jgi:hypothetical protein
VSGGAVPTAASISTYWGGALFYALAIRGAHAHIKSMFDEIEIGDIDVDAWALDRWSGEVGATRSMKLQAEKQPVRILPQQGCTPDVFYDLWRFSCEMPDAPHLSHKPAALPAPRTSY